MSPAPGGHLRPGGGAGAAGHGDVVLHVGAPKTGTTAVQQFLRDNEGRIPGHTHPLVLRGAYARNLLAYARSPRLSTRDSRLLGIGADELPAFCRRFAEEVRRSLGTGRTVVCCNELLFRLDAEAVDRVAELFGRPLKVVAYLRRHDELAVSSYLQARKRGMVRADVFPEPPPAGFRSVLETWSRAGEVTVRLYDRVAMPGGDVVLDFLRVLGVEPASDLVRTSEANPSWGRQQLQLGEHLDRAFPFLDPALTPTQRKARRADLVRFLNGLPRDRHPLTTRDRARSFVSHYRDDDEWVRARYFPERASLFSDDFSTYPPEVPRAELSLEDALTALVELWRFHEAEQQVLRERVALLESSWLTPRSRRVVRPWRPRPRAGSR